MTVQTDRSWSCYPDGPEMPRRRFLRALAVASAGAAIGISRRASVQEAAVDESVLSTEDVVAFPEGAVRLNFNENPLGPSPRAIAAILENGLGESPIRRTTSARTSRDGTRFSRESG